MQPSIEPNRMPARVRRPRRPPAAVLPEKKEDRRTSSIVSMLLHVLVIALLTMPAAIHTGDVIEIEQGAGGPGPAGGGGGGHSGTGGVTERVTYVQPAAPPAPAPSAVIPPPVALPQPVVAPPEIKPPAEPVPEAKPEVKPAEPKAAEATAPTPGTGGGTGRDGTNGSGPGSGGGVGSGVGTGRGSGVGPGTGGGTQQNFAPAAIELFIPPLPIPARVKGFHLVAEWEVDETGKVVDGTFKFTATPDRGYNKRLDEVLKNTKFRPGTTPDGKPIRMKAQITYDF